MSELRQIAQHPEADTLNAFAENALPAHEREQTLLHLASCEDCRAIVFMAQEAAADELPAQPERVVAARRPWFSKAIFAWPMAAALAAVMAFTIYLRHPSSIRPTPAVTSHASVQQPPLPQTIPVPEIPTASPRRIPKPNVPPTPSPAHAPSVLGGISSAPDAGKPLLSAQQIENLPIEGRRIDALPLQTANGITGSERRTASAGLGSGRGAAPASTQDQVQATAPLPIGVASPRAVALDAPIATSAPQPAGETVTVSAAGAELAVDALTVDSVLSSDAAASHLPSHLAPISTTTSGSQMLAVDTAGTLFRSTDSGHHWKQVRSVWAGSAVRVNLVAAPAAPITLDGTLTQGAMTQFAAQTPPKIISAGALLSISLQGSVTDASGASIPGATVAVTAASASTPRTIKTDAAGNFALHGLAPGVYRVQVESPGFQTTQLQTTLAATPRPPLKITLPVGAEAETVTVQSSSSAMSQVEKSTARRRTSAPPVFEITTSAGAVWTSSDGLHWQPR